jgi:hypothetical protein
MLLDSMTAISGKVNSASVCSMCAIPPRIEVDFVHVPAGAEMDFMTCMKLHMGKSRHGGQQGFLLPQIPSLPRVILENCAKFCTLAKFLKIFVVNSMIFWKYSQKLKKFSRN